MNLLVLDTSGEQALVAASRNNEYASRTALVPRQHAEHLLPMIQAVMDELSLTPSQLTAIGVCIGPGSFVGIRIAVSAVQALSYAWDLPIIPLSSLAVMAQAAFRSTMQTHIAVLRDARMNQIYAGFYETTKQGIVQAVSSDSLTHFNQLAYPYEANWLRVGQAWSLSNSLSFSKDIFIEKVEPLDLILPSTILYSANQTVKAQQLIPVYLQDSSIWKKMS